MDKKLFKKAQEQGFNHLQIMQLSANEINIETLNDKLDKFETMFTDNYTVSAIYNGKKVQITTEYLDEYVLDLLKQQAEYLDAEEDFFPITLENIQDDSEYEIDNSTSIIEQLLNLNRFQKKYPQIVEINNYYTESIIIRKIFTETITLADKKKIKSLSIEILAKDKEKTSTAYNSEKNIDNSNIDINSIFEFTIQNAIDKLYYQEIKDGTYSVILTSKVMGKILDKFIHLFSADSIQKGISLLNEKQNKKVFSEKITMIEDPINVHLVGKRLFDDAGCKTYTKEIVKKGVFKQALYDQKTAIIDKTQSTGNDYGEISVRNLYIEKGKKDLEQLIESLNEGILIDCVNGLHAGINPINGNISLQAEGYYIKNGKKEYATKLFVLSTNIMDILNNVIDLSNHIDFFLTTCASPDILLENIKISK